MRLLVLGSGSAFSGVGHNAGYCLDGRILVDCGAPVHRLLRKAGIAIGDITTILLTHFHADHVATLPVVLGARALEVENPRPLRLAGPVGTREYALRLLRTTYGRALHAVVLDRLGLEATVLADGSDTVVDGYRIRAHAIVHSLGPSLAYAVTGPDGATVGFSGDATLCPGLHRVAAQSDLLVCECTGWDGPVPSHLWRGEVEQVMAAHPETAILLSHLSDRRRLDGALVAHDLLELEVTPPGRPLPTPPASVLAG